MHFVDFVFFHYDCGVLPTNPCCSYPLPRELYEHYLHSHCLWFFCHIFCTVWRVNSEWSSKKEKGCLLLKNEGIVENCSVTLYHMYPSMMLGKTNKIFDQISSCALFITCNLYHRNAIFCYCKNQLKLFWSPWCFEDIQYWKKGLIIIVVLLNVTTIVILRIILKGQEEVNIDG